MLLEDLLPHVPITYCSFKYSCSQDIIPILLVEHKMPKVSVEIPREILDDLTEHVGDNKKFVNLSDAIRTACRKMLDQLDEIDMQHGRLKNKPTGG